MKNASAWMLVLAIGMGLLAGCSGNKEDGAGDDTSIEGDGALEPYPVTQIPQAEPQPEAPPVDTGDSNTGTVKQLPDENYAPPKTTGSRIYVVKKGDTLYSISRKMYGTMSKHRAIYDANRDVLKQGPDVLQVGMKLVLP